MLGAGAIGSLYGAKLAGSNAVTLVGNAAHVAAIKREGLRVDGCEELHVRVRAEERLEKIAPHTLLLLATKVTDTRNALAPLASLVRRDTTILCLQNGIGIEQLAREALGSGGIVLRAIPHGGALFREPGAITWMTRGETVIEQHERSAKIVAAFNQAGLEARESPHLAADVWHKLVINCVVNPITAILGCEVKGIVDPGLDPLKQLVIDECLAVAAAEGVSLGGALLQHINIFFAASGNIASMQQDLRRGRPTEIGYLNGAVVALGAKHGIGCPVNAALTAIIKAMEAGRRHGLRPEEMFEPQLRQS